jgi:5S rRNA maturation endonuclease (ribonuclease M5)
VGAVGRYIGSSQDVPRYNNYWAKIHKKCEKPSNQSGTWCSFCREKIHPVEDVRKGFERKFFLFGEHLFPKGANAVLVEGPIDTVKTWQALQGTDFFPLGCFGSELSPEQVKKATSLTKDKLILLFDPDEAGKKAAEKLQKKAGRKIKIFSSQYPIYEAEEQPDPGSLPPEEIRSAVLHARLTL